MTENLSLEKINSIVVFQKKYRFMKNEMKQINSRVIFLKIQL